MRIRLIIPIKGLTEQGIRERLEYLRSLASPGVEIDAAQVEVGPPAIESEVDAIEAGPEILRLVKEAEDSGCNAVIIWCAGDPALEASRQMVDIPVIGPGESMRILSYMLGSKPCEVTPDIPVLEMRRDMEKTVGEIRKAVKAKIDRGEGDSFYLGCLALWGLGKKLREELEVPILDGAESSLIMAESAVRLDLRHSRIAYPKYSPKNRII